MKICFISEAFSVHTQRWTAGIASLGHEVHLISRTTTDIPGVRMHQRDLYHVNPFRAIVNLLRIRRLIMRIDPDIIHLFGLFSVNNFFVMWLIKPWQHLVISIWGSDIVPAGIHETIMERIVKRRIVGCGRLVCATSDYLSEATRRYARTGQRIVTVSWGVDTQVFSPFSRPKPSREAVVGFAKRLHILAGPDILIRAYYQAVKNRAPLGKLRIAGQGPMEQELKILASKLGIDNLIEWSAGLTTLRNFVNFTARSMFS
jgi:glycosyltransferase involved in cell wall biosynthesis